MRLGRRLYPLSLATNPSLDVLRNSPHGRHCPKKGLKAVNLLIKPTDGGFACGI